MVPSQIHFHCSTTGTPDRIYSWLLESLLLGGGWAHIYAPEANLDTDEEDVEGREKERH